MCVEILFVLRESRINHRMNVRLLLFLKQKTMMKKLFTFLLLLIGTVEDIYAQEPYAALNADNLTQTFYYDDNKDAKGGMNVGLFTYNWSSGVNSDWYDQCESITSVLFDETFADYKDLTSTVCWFYSCKNLATIIGIENLNSDNVTDIS